MSFLTSCLLQCFQSGIDFWLAPCRTKWDNGRARGKQNSATVDRTSVTSCLQQQKHCWRVRKSHRGYLRCSRNCLAWGDTALPKTPSYRGKGNPTSRSHPTLDAHLNIAAKVWNALPPAITSLSSLGAFKRALKTEPFRRSYGNANYRPQQHWRYSCSVFMNDLRRDEIRRWWWWWWLISEWPWTSVFIRSVGNNSRKLTESLARPRAIR